MWTPSQVGCLIWWRAHKPGQPIADQSNSCSPTYFGSHFRPPLYLGCRRDHGPGLMLPRESLEVEDDEDSDSSSVSTREGTPGDSPRGSSARFGIVGAEGESAEGGDEGDDRMGWEAEN